MVSCPPDASLAERYAATCAAFAVAEGEAQSFGHVHHICVPIYGHSHQMSRTVPGHVVWSCLPSVCTALWSFTPNDFYEMHDPTTGGAGGGDGRPVSAGRLLWTRGQGLALYTTGSAGLFHKKMNFRLGLIFN